MTRDGKLGLAASGQSRAEADKEQRGRRWCVGITRRRQLLVFALACADAVEAT